MSKKLKIVSIASEVAPFSKTGGLGDVAMSLPKALKKLGHEIIIITPFYEQIIDKEKNNLKIAFENVKIHLNPEDSVVVTFWKGYLEKGLPAYFIENKKYFSQRKTLYGSTHENARFLIFDVAALKLLSLLKFEADIIHCHDWQTGLVPYLLKTDFRDSQTLRKAKTVFTIHNLVFQLGHDWWSVPPDKKDYGKKPIPRLDDPELEYINFAKRAILSADVINTVSEQHREEIMTKKYGQDLDRILRNREDRLFGIVNGIDYREFNPANDPGMFKNYDHTKIHRKKLNKESLQKQLNLPVDKDIAVLGMTSRLTFQKGLELISEILDPLAHLNVQLIILGDGDKAYIDKIKKYAKKYPKKIAYLPFTDNEKMETLIYAGADIFLLPSHHEPCGINQLKAMRYGCIPVVRKVGGLSDTVKNYNPATGQGTGLSFSDFNPFSLYGAIIRALENYRHKKSWRQIVVRAMKESNSWEIPAKKYVTLYKKALSLKLKNGENKKIK